jgi:hypothetical protein
MKNVNKNDAESPSLGTSKNVELVPKETSISS